jgi:hypothetical protein
MVKHKHKLIALVAVSLVSGCAMFPQTRAAYETGGTVQAIDTFLSNVGGRVVTGCETLDGIKLSTSINIIASVANKTKDVERIRKERQDECKKYSGVFTAVELDIE